jgi:hypothetical protein
MTSSMSVLSANLISTSLEGNTIAETVEALSAIGVANTLTMLLVMAMKGSVFAMHATGTRKGSKD